MFVSGTWRADGEGIVSLRLSVWALKSLRMLSVAVFCAFAFIEWI